MATIELSIKLLSLLNRQPEDKKYVLWSRVVVNNYITKYILKISYFSDVTETQLPWHFSALYWDHNWHNFTICRFI